MVLSQAEIRPKSYAQSLAQSSTQHVPTATSCAGAAAAVERLRAPPLGDPIHYQGPLAFLGHERLITKPPWRKSVLERLCRGRVLKHELDLNLNPSPKSNPSPDPNLTTDQP